MAEDYRNKWARENRSRVVLLVKPEEHEKIKEKAASNGESVNAYIKRLIDKDMEETKNGNTAND